MMYGKFYFNGKWYEGITEEDRKAIEAATDDEVDLKIDECGRVWNSGDQYISDAKQVDIM